MITFLREASQVAEWLALPTLDLVSNPAGDGIQLVTVWHFIAQSLSLSPFHVERGIKHQISRVFTTVTLYS